MSIHRSAQYGFKEASLYELYRPSYTKELVNYVIQSLYTGSEQTTQYDVLELGTGTGKFTRNMFQHLEKPLRYLATEPIQEFLTKFQQLCPDIEITQCDAAHIPLPDGSVQNIICAQCFHWFANKESLDEMLRVLVPGGRVFLIWIHRNAEVDWAKEAEIVLKEYFAVSNTPDAIARDWKPFLEKYQCLRLLEHSFLPGVQNLKGSKAFVIEHYASISVVAMLKGEENDKARAKFKVVLDKYFDDHEEITIPFFTECYLVEKVN